MQVIEFAPFGFLNDDNYSRAEVVAFAAASAVIPWEALTLNVNDAGLLTGVGIEGTVIGLDGHLRGEARIAGDIALTFEMNGRYHKSWTGRAAWSLTDAGAAAKAEVLAGIKLESPRYRDGRAEKTAQIIARGVASQHDAIAGLFNRSR